MTNIPKLYTTETSKHLRSKDYNFNFDLATGYFERWGEKIENDPTWSPFGPEIADIEITTICKGPKVRTGKLNDGSNNEVNKLCKFCYKSNTPNGKYMSFDTFKNLLDKFPKFKNKDGKSCFVVNQIAFGCDAECKSNPDVWKIFRHCRENGIVPNLTIASIDYDTAQNIAKYCGACAVSRYSDKEVCYDTVELLSQKCGMTQVNIHQIVCKSSLDNIWETLHDIKTDRRLSKLNAIVFLSLKKKGRGITEESISQEEYAKIVQYCLNNGINFGSDSCGAGKLLKSLTKEQFDKIISCVEPCEAAKHSFYCDVEGNYYPCSFMANENGDWKTGINVLNINNFITDLWQHKNTIKFRNCVDKCNESFGGCCHFNV